MSTRKPPLDEEGVEPVAERIRDLPRARDRVAGRRILFWIAAAAALTLIALLITGALGSEAFRKLAGKDISARLTGMELTDDVHWTYVFGKGGRLTSVSMGKSGNGTWRVQGDEVCWDGGRRERCREVWMFGTKVQLRTRGSDMYDEGVLRKPRQ